MGGSLPFGNRVRELRRQHGGVTQAELGQAIGVTRQTIIAIEQGRYSPSLESAFRIARHFSVGLEDVFVWIEDSAPGDGSADTAPESPASRPDKRRSDSDR